MKAKKLYRDWKQGEEFKKGVFWCVKGLRKRIVQRRTCRFQKHKGDKEE